MRNIILLVDEAEGNRAKLDKALSSSFEIIHAQDEKMAISSITANAKRLCAVIIDSHIKGDGAVQAVKYMAAMELIGVVPIIFSTSFNVDDDNQREWEQEIDDIIVRPFDSDIVRRRVRNLVELYNYRRGKNCKI